MRYRRDHKSKTREKILVSAAAFRLHGFDGASVRQIMADAGLTVGGVYAHFESKSDLFEEVLLRAGDLASRGREEGL